MICSFGSCNNETKEEIELSGNYTSCAVTGFNLVKDDSILAHLDSVFFSIDLPTGEIYNADSLPVGTKVDKLLVNITAATVSGCDLTYRIPGTDRDTTVSYIENQKDSINFADGPVKMKVTSYNGLATYEYTIKVNVHTVEPDTLYWAEAARRALPTSLRAPVKQKTVSIGDKVFCVVSDGSASTLAVSEDLYSDVWTITDVVLPAGADIESFSSSSDALYILDESGNLFTSVDGASWEATGERMTHIYGGYGDKLLGVLNDGSGWQQVSYPDGALSPLPAGCPVSGTSNLVTYETKWSASLLAIMLGGCDVEGNLTGAAWGYDGTSWTRLSARDIDPMEGVAIFPYSTPRVSSTNFSVTERSALIAMGGRYDILGGSCAVADTIYISYDQGLNWAPASSYLQFAKTVPGFYGAQAIVCPTQLSVSRTVSDGWDMIPTRRLPAWASPIPFVSSRVSTAIDEWDCPYIYLFGGYDANGQLRNSLWRGVIRRFTFRPLY